MIIHVGSDGALRLPDAIVQRAALHGGSSMYCQLQDKSIVLTPVNALLTGDFPPNRRAVRAVLWHRGSLSGGTACSHRQQKGQGTAGDASA